MKVTELVYGGGNAFYLFLAQCLAYLNRRKKLSTLNEYIQTWRRKHQVDMVMALTMTATDEIFQ